MNRSASEFVLNDRSRTRILELLRRCDAQSTRSRFHLPLFKRVCQVLRERNGADFEDVDCHSIEEAIAVGSVNVEDSMAAMFISATSEHLRQLTGAPMSADDFEAHVNEILAADDGPYRLVHGNWLTTGKTEADVLRRVLLRGDDELAGCRQGDQQVEMVVLV